MEATLGSVLQFLLGFVIIAIIGVLSAYSLYILYIRNKYSHIPLPKPVSFWLGHIPAIQKASKKDGNIQLLLCEWSQTYGSTFLLILLHEVVVVTCNPDNVKELMVTGNFPKSKRYKVVGWTFGARVMGRGLVTELDHEKWSVRRLALNPAFHRTVLKDTMNEFNSACDELVKVLSLHADKNAELRLLPLMHKTTLDVIGKVAFGKDLGSLQDDVSPFAKAIFDMMHIINTRIQNPLLQLPFRAKALKARIKEVMKHLRETSMEWIIEREEASKRGDYIPDDILTYMMKLRENADFMTDEIMQDDFVTLFIAGQETTANTTSFMLMEAGRHPEILKRLKDEVDEVIGQKPHITFEDVSKLEYMTMVWKETLRMYAIVPVSFRDVDRDGYKIDGYEIPRDTIAMTSSFLSARNPSLINDPLTFNPERFAPDSTDRPNPYAYFPFAIGPRNCIGQTFAQLEGKVILTKILQNFDYDLDPNQNFGIEEAATLKPAGGVKVKISWRKSK